MSELSALIERHCTESMTQTAVPNMILSRSDCVTTSGTFMYHPLLCLVASGRKRLTFGDDELFYDPDHYLIASLDLPVSGQVVEAPCLGLTLRLDLDRVASLLLEMPGRPPQPLPLRGLATEALDSDLRQPLVRLLKLLDEPEHAPILAPMIEGEILYRLLLGPQGPMLTQMALPEGPVAQVQRSIKRVRESFAQPLRVEDLASAALMSTTSFHRHFRAVTAMSPLQYLKQVRLLEARRMLVMRPNEVSQIGLEVGYESASQFSREYRRLFGMPPSQDASRLRQILATGNAVERSLATASAAG